MPNNGSQSTKEPDVLATQLVDSPVLAAEGETLPLPSIVVVEIKRPMRNDASEDKDPIQQCLDYVKLVRAGRVGLRLGDQSRRRRSRLPFATSSRTSRRG